MTEQTWTTKLFALVWQHASEAERQHFLKTVARDEHSTHGPVTQTSLLTHQRAQRGQSMRWGG